MNMTPKQEAFALAYCELGNATEAYRRVYTPVKSTPKTINESASKLLAHPKVAARIKAQRDAAATNVGLTVERTLRELAILAYSDGRRLMGEDGRLLPVNEWPDDVAPAVKSIETGPTGVKVTFWDKKGALDMAMKHLGQYEKDNLKRVDPIADMMAEIAARGVMLAVKP